MILCKHKFVHGGVKYEDGRATLPGSGARDREYFDWFYCEYCLENKFVLLGYDSNTYAKVEFNATPKQQGQR